MHRGRLHAGAAWLCLALHLCASLGVSSLLVLCVGSSGHLAIESRFSDDCCEDHVAENAVSQLAAVDACRCTDSSVLQPAVGSRSDDDRGAPASIVVLGAAAPHAGPILPHTARRFAGTDPPRPPSVTALRSVVLVV
jgi:hypothetical protein